MDIDKAQINIINSNVYKSEALMPNQTISTKNNLRVESEANGLFKEFMREAPKTSRNPDLLQSSLRFD
jgi:hypothetical protein